MKFGRNLPQFTVPEWSGHYIKYKALKKLIKSAAEKVKTGQEADLAGKCQNGPPGIPHAALCICLIRMARLSGPARIL